MRWLPWMVAVSAIGCLAGSTNRRIDETFELSRRRAPDGAQGSTGGRESEDFSAPVTRLAILSRIVARDPGLTARAYRVRAALHEARAAGSLPPPEVNAQIWNLPLGRPYALGEADMYMLEVRQAFPAAGSRDARARAGVEDARAMAAELAIREQELVERASRTYADYVRATLDRRLRSRFLDLLAAMFDAARARFASGSATLADVVRVEVEQARTRRVIARDDGDLARARATLNALLLRPTDAPLGLPADIAPQTVRLPLDALVAQAARTQGAQAQAQARILAARARTTAARAEATWPTFMVGLSYWQDPQMRPGLGAMVSASLPWVWGGQRQRLAAARETEAAEAASAREVTVETRAGVGAALARLDGLERQLTVLRIEARPSASRAVQAMRAMYTAGNSDLLAWLDTARSVLEIEMEEADLTAELGQTTAELERTVGALLPRTEAGAEREERP